MDILYYDQASERHYKAVVKSPVQYIAEKIEKMVIGIVPSGTNSLCFDENSKSSLEEFTNKLQKNNIPFDITNPYDNRPCVYWSAEEDKKVEDAYPTYKAIKEACKKDPRCKK